MERGAHDIGGKKRTTRSKKTAKRRAIKNARLSAKKAKKGGKK